MLQIKQLKGRIFNQKLKRKTFSPEELSKIAEALGGIYVFCFIFPDGTKI